MDQKRVGWYERKAGVGDAVGLPGQQYVLCFMPDGLLGRKPLQNRGDGKIRQPAARPETILA
jgi:hypothetical protein